MAEQLWQVVTLDTEFTTTNNSTPQATGLSFTPSANTRYWVRGLCLCTSSTTTWCYSIGWRWPSGLDLSAGSVNHQATAAANFDAVLNWGAATDGVTTIGGGSRPMYQPPGSSPTDEIARPVMLDAILHAGASPSGDLEVLLQVVATGTATAKLLAGSCLWIWEF